MGDGIYIETRKRERGELRDVKFGTLDLRERRGLEG